LYDCRQTIRSNRAEEVTVPIGSGIAIGLSGIGKTFATRDGAPYIAVEDISVDVHAGKFLALVGPSGCGKSTILNMAAGLLRPTAGTIRVFGENLNGVNRRASYMFQQEALLPWKTVLENIRLGLDFRGCERREANRQALLWLERVGLENFAAHFPHQLSGGMRRRAAMAQSWIVDPDMILMDEPFGALDAQTRIRMQGELLRLWSGSGKTVLLVTHDLEEAITLSDELAILSAGPRSRLAARYAVDLPRPRDAIDIRMEPRFTEIYRTVWNVLRTEVMKSHA
jgi:NitT/TauT family transport system ATP-binding protein